MVAYELRLSNGPFGLPACGRNAPLRRATLSRSISGGVLEHQADRLEDDVEVQPQRPVAQVVQVAADAPFHLFQRVGFAAEPVHLGPSRDAGPDLVPDHVALDL